jgi:protein-tyrosine phosphatase
MREYLLSDEEIRRAFSHVLDDFALRGGDPELVAPILSVRPAYLDMALREMHTTYGSVERYFSDGLGVDEPTGRALRDAFLEPVPEA